MKIKFNKSSGFYCEGYTNQEDCMKLFREYLEPKTKLKNEFLYGLEGRDFAREKVRIRDNHTCQICGKKWEKTERRLDVHHLDEYIEGKKAFKYQNNTDTDRMITLCHKCHLGLPHIRRKMSGQRKSYSLLQDLHFK